MSENSGVLIIASDTVLTGEVRGARRVEVYGSIEGGISAGDVTVRPGGSVRGGVNAETSTVEGALTGDVRIKQLISIKSSGSVTGKVKYGRLAMEEGAELAASVRNVPPSIAGDLDLSVRRGATVRITPADLSAVDPDDAPSSLLFRVYNVWGGRIVFADQPSAAIESFTQADLLAGRTYFAHDGSAPDRAQFDVVVSDASGASSGSPQTVKVAVVA